MLILNLKAALASDLNTRFILDDNDGKERLCFQVSVGDTWVEFMPMASNDTGKLVAVIEDDAAVKILEPLAKKGNYFIPLPTELRP